MFISDRGKLTVGNIRKIKKWKVHSIDIYGHGGIKHLSTQTYIHDASVITKILLFLTMCFYFIFPCEQVLVGKLVNDNTL